MFTSNVGIAVWVAAGRVGDSITKSVIGWERGEPVGVQEIGWKGVGVAVAFGADVTKTNGRPGCAWAEASVPHPASKTLMRSITGKSFLIRDTVQPVCRKL